MLLYYSQHFLRKVLEMLSLEIVEWFDVFLETQMDWMISKVRSESHDRKIGICLFWVFLLLIYKNKFYSWLCWVFFTARAFSSSGEQRLLSSCSLQVCPCCGFSCCGALSLGMRTSTVAAPVLLEHRLNSCGAWA